MVGTVNDVSTAVRQNPLEATKAAAKGLYSGAVSPVANLAIRYAPGVSQDKKNAAMAFMSKPGQYNAPSDTYGAINQGFNMAGMSVPYMAGEAAITGAAKALPVVGKFLSGSGTAAKVANYGLRRASDVITGDQLTDPSQYIGGSRLKNAAANLAMGAGFEGTAAVAGKAFNALRLSKNVGKMDLSVPGTHQTGVTKNGSAIIETKPYTTKTIPNHQAEYLLKNDKLPPKGSILPRDYKTSGNTTIKLDSKGNLVSWTTDSQAFKDKMSQHKILDLPQGATGESGFIDPNANVGKPKPIKANTPLSNEAGKFSQAKDLANSLGNKYESMQLGDIKLTAPQKADLHQWIQFGNGDTSKIPSWISDLHNQATGNTKPNFRNSLDKKNTLAKEKALVESGKNTVPTVTSSHISYDEFMKSSPNAKPYSTPSNINPSDMIDQSAYDKLIQSKIPDMGNVKKDYAVSELKKQYDPIRNDLLGKTKPDNQEVITRAQEIFQQNGKKGDISKLAVSGNRDANRAINQAQQEIRARKVSELSQGTMAGTVENVPQIDPQAIQDAKYQLQALNEALPQHPGASAVDQATNEVQQVLQNSQAGARYFNGSEYVTSSKSSFPDWVPASLRKKTLFNAVNDAIKKGVAPKGAAQLDLYNLAQEQIKIRAEANPASSEYARMVEQKSQLENTIAGANQATNSVEQSLPKQPTADGQTQNLSVLPKETTPPLQDQSLPQSKPLQPESPATKTLESLNTPNAEIVGASGDKIKPVAIEDAVHTANVPVEKKINLLDYLRTPDRVLEKIGLGKEANLLQEAYGNYQAELPKEIEKIRAWSEGVTPEQNQQLFKYLDGQKVQLDPQMQKIAGEVQTYLKGWAKRLGLPEDRQVSSYITHIFEKDFIGKEFPEEIAGMIRDKIPGSVYDPFTTQRLGKKGYIEDTWRALEAYVKRGTRKANMDPVLGQVKIAADKLEQSQFAYVKSYMDRINMRPTEIDNLVDNLIKTSPIGYKFGQRPITSLSKTARQWIYRGTLGLNPGSALKNLSQGANTYAKLGEKYTVTGYTNAIKNLFNGSQELEKVGVLGNDIIQDKVVSAGKQALQKMDSVLFFMFEKAEKINRGAAYFGAKAKALAAGATEKEAIAAGVKLARDTQFTFGSVDTPPVLASDVGKTLGQFQSFTLKQAEFLGEMAIKKDVAGMIRWAAASLAFTATVGSAIGMGVKDLVPTLRFGMPPALAPIAETVKAGLNTPDKYGQERSPWQKAKDVGKTLLPFVPGGTQIKKTIEGIQAVNQGGSLTAAGRVRAPIEKTPINYARGALFGQYNLPGVKDFFNNKQTPLGAADSKVYMGLPDNLKADFFKQVTGQRDANKQVDAAKELLGKSKGDSSVGIGSDGKLPDGVISAGGKYVYKIDGEVKTSSDLKAVTLAMNKQSFKESGQDFLKKDGSVFYMENGEVKVENAVKFDNSIAKAKYDIALQESKANNDFDTWAKTQSAEYDRLEAYKKSLNPKSDEAEIIKITNTQQDIMAQVDKYSSYGGAFKKGKKGKKLSTKKLAAGGSAGSLKTISFGKAPAAKKISLNMSGLNSGSSAKLPTVRFATSGSGSRIRSANTGSIRQLAKTGSGNFNYKPTFSKSFSVAKPAKLKVKAA